MEKPKGYKKYFERHYCYDCMFSYTNKDTVPSQEITRFCRKVTPDFEVCDDDVCDEYKAKKKVD